MARKTTDQLEAERQELLAEIRSLKAALQQEQKIVKEKEEQLRLVDEVKTLRETITNLEITKAKAQEDRDREKREVEHMVGLERKRQAFEIDQAKRETTVTVREENLKADKDRFQEQMKFTTERFEKEVGYLKEIMTQVLERLPTVTVDRVIEPPTKGD